MEILNCVLWWRIHIRRASVADTKNEPDRLAGLSKLTLSTPTCNFYTQVQNTTFTFLVLFFSFFLLHVISEKLIRSFYTHIKSEPCQFHMGKMPPVCYFLIARFKTRLLLMIHTECANASGDVSQFALFRERKKRKTREREREKWSEDGIRTGNKKQREENDSPRESLYFFLSFFFPPLLYFYFYWISKRTLGRQVEGPKSKSALRQVER